MDIAPVDLSEIDIQEEPFPEPESLVVVEPIPLEPWQPADAQPPAPRQPPIVVPEREAEK
mgnify:CR=1 FL=1